MLRWLPVMLVATFGFGCGATGGDLCETDDDCGDMKCLPNYQGGFATCTLNADEPAICATPCTTNDDCGSAEWDDVAAPSCITDCMSNGFCMPEL